MRAAVLGIPGMILRTFAVTVGVLIIGACVLFVFLAVTADDACRAMLGRRSR